MQKELRKLKLYLVSNGFEKEADLLDIVNTTEINYILCAILREVVAGVDKIPVAGEGTKILRDEVADLFSNLSFIFCNMHLGVTPDWVAAERIIDALYSLLNPTNTMLGETLRGDICEIISTAETELKDAAIKEEGMTEYLLLELASLLNSLFVKLCNIP